MTKIKYLFYRWFMRLAHKHDWHYAPPIYPGGSLMLLCHWCGFRQVIDVKSHRDINQICPAKETVREDP